MLIAMSLCAFVASTTNQTFAQAGSEQKPAKEGAGAGHSHFIKIPPTAEEVWKEIASQQTKLAAVVAKNNLGEAHDHGYAIRDLVKALPGMVPAESKPKAEAAVAEIVKIAAAIDKSSAGGAQKATQENVKKMEAAVNALQADLKAK